MGMPQLVVTAVLVEGRTKSEVARDYGVSRRWVQELVARFLAEGEAGLQPRAARNVDVCARRAKSGFTLESLGDGLPQGDALLCIVVRHDGRR